MSEVPAGPPASSSVGKAETAELGADAASQWRSARRNAEVTVPAASPSPPDPPYVAAAKNRKKAPVWAMMAFSLMPLWLFMYVRAVTEPPDVATGPLGVGAEIYSNCASCHGSAGEGNAAGRQFDQGEVLKTFPHIEDHIRFVYFGTPNYNVAGVASYGNPQRDGGPHLAGSLGPMPAWGETAGGELSDADLLAVVCHERFTLSDADSTGSATEEEFNDWCAADSPIYASLQAGIPLAELADAGILDADGRPIPMVAIGDTPAAGSPPDNG